MVSKDELGCKNVIWDLSDLFSGINDKKIDNVIEESCNKSKLFQEEYKNKVKDLTSANLSKAFTKLENLLLPLYKLSQFSSLQSSIDVNNQSIKKLSSKVDDCESTVSNNLIFFDLEIGKCTREQYEKWLASKDLKNYTYSIQRSCATKQYDLDESSEKWITIKNVTGKNGFKQLYSELTSSFKFKITINNERKELTGPEIRNLRLHQNPKVRRKAMKLFFNKYKDNKIVLSHIFNQIIKDFNTERKKRGYQSAINLRNISNDLPDEVINILHNITTDSNHLVARYYKIKRKLLNLNTMTLADIYAPLPEINQQFTFKEAKEIVLKAFKSFDNEFYEISNHMFKSKRVHAPVQKNKRGGAFCSGYTPDTYPYVMLNFLGKPRDISTLAHEFGHAIHDVLASKQNLTNYHPILPLAETASVFSEMITTDLLKKHLKSKQSKIILICEKLEDIFATSHRQNMFSEFEKKVHNKISDNIISFEDCSEIYKNELKKMFSDSVKITEEYHYEWITIPHFLDYPFYVYSYNFGNLLVFSLYTQYLNEGSSFIPKFKKLLASGSSKSPIDITKEAGLNIESKDFWTNSIKYIEEMINELETLVNT